LLQTYNSYFRNRNVAKSYFGNRYVWGMKFTELEQGKVALIMQTDNGDIVQLGLTPNQSDMLNAFVAAMSKEEKLVQLPKDFNLTLKNK